MIKICSLKLGLEIKNKKTIGGIGMKKFSFKGRKHAVTATCLLVGMFVLTSAVYANYDDARGYTNYKDAVKKLAFYEENFTTEGEMSVLVDGKKMASMKGTFKLDDDDLYISTVSQDSFSKEDNKGESIEITKDGTKFYYSPDSNSYSEYEDESNDFRPDMSDPTIKKSIKFVELFADTMVGDLKNNFVLTSKDGDNRNYSVNVSGSQIPEVVNAGISLMFTAANEENSTSSYVTYEDYHKTFAAYYKEKTGKEMTEEMYNEWSEEISEVDNSFYDKYNDILESKGDVGIVYVKEDGTYEYYKTYSDYQKEIEPESFNERDIMTKLGNDPYIDNAMCNFTLDKKGRLISNDMQASMVGVDKNGKKHTFTLKMNYKVSDYGTTEVEDFDTAGKTKLD